MSLTWVAEQISSIKAKGLGLEVPRYNPRPAGVIRDGSATQQVLGLLAAHRGQYFTHHQILVQTKRTQKSVCWALIYLKSLSLIDCAPDDGRNSRYLRYCAPKQQTRQVNKQ
jgi:hypothetical protein